MSTKETKETKDKTPKNHDAKSDNTSLLSWFVSILCRITYEPPLIYKLALLEIKEILAKHNYLDSINKQIAAASFAQDQNTFIDIFRELEYLKACHEMGFITDSIYNLESENIFSKNNLNQEDFQNQIKEYLEDLPEFESILKELQSKLESN